MANNSTVHVRMDETLKEHAEMILAQIGLTSSDAIKLFYRQIELNGGLPFELKIPEKIAAENRLFEELSIGERSAEEKGWLSVADSKRALGL